MARTELVVTAGIILGKRAAGESNTLIAVLTRECGLIRASAKSARLQKAKLRYGLEPLTLGTYSFVRGRTEWKVVGAERLLLPFSQSPLWSRTAAGRICKLLTRLIHGEEASPPLYDLVAEGLALLAAAKTPEETESIETVLVLRILFSLGYVPKTPELAPYLDGSLLDIAVHAARARSDLIRAINESLRETGL